MLVENIFTYSITGLSLIAAILAWIAKIRWSKEFKEAKQAQIDVLEQHIKALKDLTPDRIKKFYVDTTELLNLNIDKLEENNKELEENKKELKEKIFTLEHKLTQFKFGSLTNVKAEQELKTASFELGKMVNEQKLKEDELKKLKIAFKNINKKGSELDEETLEIVKLYSLPPGLRNELLKLKYFNREYNH